MRRKLILHGYLQELCPDPVYVVADTVAEAISGLCSMTGKALAPDLKNGRHQVKVVGFDTVDSLQAPTDVEELHIVPSFCGGKSGGIFQILLGAVLVVVGIVTLNPMIILFGAVTILGGILQMLSPAPKVDTGSQDPEGSKYLQADKNTVKIGTRIPMLIGLFPVYGQYLSFNIDAKQVNDPQPFVAPTTTVLGGVNYYFH